MKLVKSLLLGSAAGVCAVAGAQAADLPMRKAAPVEYVRVCTAYGAGFFYIPGTDTCLRIGGRARFEYQYTSGRSANTDVSGFRGTGRFSFDSRTQTAYGTLRTFVRVDIMSRTGGYLKSGTQERLGNAFPAFGQDTIGHVQKYIEIDKAFVQFAGFTAGRSASFFDFYAHDGEYIGSSIGSDVSSTNLLAYTATFGNGFSATLSIEDPTARRSGTVFAPGGFLSNVNLATSGLSPSLTGNVLFAGTGAVAVSPIATAIDPATGYATRAINLNVVQTNYMPDIVANVRYEAPWGVAQLSAAVHELRVGNYTGGVFATDYGTKTGLAGVNLFPAGQPASRNRPDAEYGYGVQGGVKFNLPMLAPGDVLWLQAAYAKGAGSYTGVYTPQGSAINSTTYTNNSSFGGYDMAVDAYGNTHLTDTWSVTANFLHYWTPEVRQAVFGSYGENLYNRALRGVASPATPNGLYYATLVNGISNAANSAFSPIGRDWNNLYVGSNITWSPVRDLDIGVEAVYEKLEFNKGKVVDLNKAVIYPTGNPLAGFPTKLISADDNVLVRMRVQRDF